MKHDLMAIARPSLCCALSSFKSRSNYKDNILENKCCKFTKQDNNYYTVHVCNILY